MNGTYINHFKVGTGRAGQLHNGDVLGIVVPSDPTRLDEGIDSVLVRMVFVLYVLHSPDCIIPILTFVEDLRDRNNRYLKYKVRIFGEPEPTPEQLVRRQYISAPMLCGAPSRPNVRKLDLPELPTPEGWLPDDVHAWAKLVPINDNTAVENLCTGKVVVGRYLGMDVLSYTISRWMNRNA